MKDRIGGSLEGLCPVRLRCGSGSEDSVGCDRMIQDKEKERPGKNDTVGKNRHGVKHPGKSAKVQECGICKSIYEV